MPEIGMHSTFEPRRMGPFAPKVTLRPIHLLGPTIRMEDAREEASAFFLGRAMHESKRVRPTNFQKWVKKFNGLGNPYDHLATFNQGERVEQVIDLHTKVEGFGLTLEGRALSWF